jgi:hypothetical protein
MRTESSVKNLAPSGQTQVSGRFITAQSIDPPIALEVAFHGALTVQSAGADGSVINAAANLIISLAILTEPAPQEEAEQLITKRVNWQVTLSYSGDDNDGSITVDLMLPGSTQAFLRLRRARITSGTSELYEILLPAPPAPPPANPFVNLARLALTADAGVLQPQNPNHALAEDGLILVQAPVIETESTFRSAAEAWLFPALPPATSELTIQALRDWVLFTRRREEQCGVGVLPPPPPPPRTYRIFNILAENPDAAQSQAQQLAQVFADPARLTVLIQGQLRIQKSQGRDFIVTFAGDSAQPLFDLAAADADWKLFQPGDKIFFAAAGERADNDVALQLSRIRTFETAISADSTEDPSAIRFPIVPLPDAAVPPDADGIMFFLTAVSRTSEQVYTVTNDHAAQWEQLTGSIPNSSVGIIGQLMALAGATQIGRVNFIGETTTIADNSAADIATQLKGMVVQDMAVWAKASDPRLGLREQQAAAFRTALGSLVQSNVQLRNLASQSEVRPPGVGAPLSAIVFLLVRTVVNRKDLIVVARFDNAGHTPAGTLNAVVNFTDATPQGSDLDKFISASAMLSAVELFTISPLDGQAAARQRAVFDALKTAGKLLNNATQASNQLPLTEHDRTALIHIGIDLTGIDDVIFVRDAG